MKKVAKLAIVACLCACVALVAASCGGQASQSSSSSVKEELSVSEEPMSSSSAKALAEDPINVLLVGNDTRFGTVDGADWAEDSPCYSDTMMVLSINPQTHSIGILSIPRDTQINLDGVDAKFNEAYYAHGITGEQGTIDQVEALTGLKIDYYFDTTFAKFEELIDGLGGVTVNVPVSLDWSDVVHDGKDGPKTHVEAGEGQTLNGAEALIFSRVRKVYSYEGEAVRQVNARQVVKSAISFVASRPETETPVYVELMERLCKTNMDAETLQAYVDAFTGTDIAFQTGSGPYVGGMYGEIWLIPRDEAAYAALADAMKNGGDMQAIVADPPVVL